MVDLLWVTGLWLVNRDVMQLNIAIGQPQPQSGCALHMHIECGHCEGLFRPTFYTLQMYPVCLWSPYGIGRPYYIFILFLLSSSFFFPRLISAVGDWMSTILRHMVWS